MVKNINEILIKFWYVLEKGKAYMMLLEML